MLSFAMLTISLIILFITANIKITILVLLVVLLVIIYMTGVCHFWGLTMNHMYAVNLSFALGLAIDYSVHIAHKYLIVEPPETMKSDQEKRDYKVSKALSQMGSSVFHGGFSTLIAVLALATARVYYFVVFFKTWLCFISFGLLNGMIL